MQDSTPMILFVGQVATSAREREGFQEIDYRRVFGGLAKWATEVDSIDRLPEVLSHAFACALSGRKGPVVVALPEDVLSGLAEVADTPAVRVAEAAPDEALIPELAQLLSQARRPLLVVGGTGWTEAARENLRAFAQAFNLPVAASFRRQDLLDNRDPQYVGQLGLGVAPALAECVRQADVLLVLGSRLSEVSSGGYQLVTSPRPAQRMVHVHPDPQELGRVYQAELPVNAAVGPMARRLASLAAPTHCAWDDWTQKARSDYLSHSAPVGRSLGQQGVEMSGVVAHLSQTLPEDAILTNGAGNYTVWVHRFFKYKTLATELAPTNGAMGYGLPAAIAAKLAFPKRTVVCFAGDGCFMMYAQELATAMQFHAAIVILLVNNGMLGTIRMHQERAYPGRVSATHLSNPDFVALAQAYGAHAECLSHEDQFPAAFARALACGKPALIELRTDPLQLTPQSRLADDVQVQQACAAG